MSPSNEQYQQKYNELLEMSPQGIFEVDSRGRIVLANKKFCSQIGMSKDEIVGKHVQTFTDDKTFREILKLIKTSREEHKLIIPIYTSHNNSFFAQIIWKKRESESGEELSTLCFVEDVTNQKNLETIQDLIMDSLSTGLWEHDFETGTAIWSKGTYLLYGLSPDDPREVTQIWGTMTSQKESSRVGKFLRDALKRPGTKVETTCEVTLNDGSLKHIAIRGESVQPQHGRECTKVRGISFDITELKEAHLRLNLTLESLKIGLWEYSPRQNKIIWSPKQYKIFGTDPQSFDGRIESFNEFVFPADRELVSKAVDEAIHTEKELNIKFRILHPTEGLRYIRGRAIVEYSHTQEVIRMIGINWDVTEEVLRENELEEQRKVALNQARLATIGEMSAGIAHEINNPLAIILGNAERIVDHLNHEKRNSEIFDHCQKIINTTDRIHKIVKGLRAISRTVTYETPQEVELVSLQSVLEDSLVLVGERLRSNSIELRTKGFNKDIFIECRPTEICQVFINLLNNSIDAIKDKPAPWIELDLFIRQDEVNLHFTDCGRGIETEIADRIMSPFFTTKSSDEGTGLGLSISESILKAHSGSIQLDTHHPTTRFTVVLPLTSKGDCTTGND